MIDANQSRSKNTAKLSYAEISENLDLDYSLEEGEHELVPLRVTGTRVIDFIDTYGIPKDDSVQAGKLPHGIGFDSYHQWVYNDLDIGSMLGLTAGNYPEREQRRLKSENKVTSEAYKRALKVSLQAHNVWERLQTLWEATQEGHITEEQKNEYNSIDSSITESMLAAEKQLPFQGHEGSKEQKLIMQQIRYNRLLYCQSLELLYNRETLRWAQETAQTDKQSGDTAEIRTWLIKEWEDLRKYQAHQDKNGNNFWIS